MPNKMILATAFMFFGGLAQASTFEISITNTSNREGFGGQNISGPALLIHEERFDLFRVGSSASRALWEIAEEGDTTAALALPNTESDVVATYKLTRIPRKQKGPSTNRFEVDRPEAARFSLAGMLTSTNDGFAGLNGQRLPASVGQKVRFNLRAWDAGSEENNEMCPYVPCADHYIRKTQGSEGFVAPHKGIQGVGDLDRLDRGWPSDNIVGFIEVKRID